MSTLQPGALPVGLFALTGNDPTKNTRATTKGRLPDLRQDTDLQMGQNKN